MSKSVSVAQVDMRIAMLRLMWPDHGDCICEHGEPCRRGCPDLVDGDDYPGDWSCIADMCSADMCDECVRLECESVEWGEPCRLTGVRVKARVDFE